MAWVRVQLQPPCSVTKVVEKSNNISATLFFIPHVYHDRLPTKYSDLVQLLFQGTPLETVTILSYKTEKQKVPINKP